MQHLICPARLEVFDDIQRTAYRLDVRGGLESFQPYPEDRTEPAMTLEAPMAESPADGRYKWASNCSHLLYDVLSDFMFHREVFGGDRVLMKKTRLADALVCLLGGTFIDPDSEQGRALTDADLARVDNRWRFVGAKHSVITRLWRRELLGRTPEPARRRNIIVSRRVRYKEWTYNRNLANLDKLCAELAQQGLEFEPVYLEDMSLADQIATFRAADIVVSTHGSGLVWLQLCRPGTVCIEVLTPYFFKTGKPKSDFWHIGRQSQIRYVPFYCDAMLGDVISAYDNDAVVTADNLLRLIAIAQARPVPESR